MVEESPSKLTRYTYTHIYGGAFTNEQVTNIIYCVFILEQLSFLNTCLYPSPSQDWGTDMVDLVYRKPFLLIYIIPECLENLIRCMFIISDSDLEKSRMQKLQFSLKLFIN